MYQGEQRSPSSTQSVRFLAQQIGRNRNRRSNATCGSQYHLVHAEDRIAGGVATGDVRPIFVVYHGGAARVDFATESFGERARLPERRGEKKRVARNAFAVLQFQCNELLARFSNQPLYRPSNEFKANRTKPTGVFSVWSTCLGFGTDGDFVGPPMQFLRELDRVIGLSVDHDRSIPEFPAVAKWTDEYVAPPIFLQLLDVRQLVSNAVCQQQPLARKLFARFQSDRESVAHGAHFLDSGIDEFDTRIPFEFFSRYN